MAGEQPDIAVGEVPIVRENLKTESDISMKADIEGQAGDPGVAELSGVGVRHPAELQGKPGEKPFLRGRRGRDVETLLRAPDAHGAKDKQACGYKNASMPAGGIRRGDLHHGFPMVMVFLLSGLTNPVRRIMLPAVIVILI
jgi:hypothetical protein